MLAEDELRDALLLIFANKQDLPNAMNAAEVKKKKREKKRVSLEYLIVRNALDVQHYDSHF